MANLSPEQLAQLQAFVKPEINAPPIPAAGDTRTVQPPIPMAPVDPSLQEQSNMERPDFNLGQNLTAAALGIAPEEAGRDIIQPDSEPKRNVDSSTTLAALPTTTGIVPISKIDIEARKEEASRIANDPNVPLEQKQKVLQALADDEETVAGEANKKLQAQQEEYDAKLKQVQDYNVLAKKYGMQEQALPTPEEFGIKPAVSDKQIQKAITPSAEEVEKQAAPIRQQFAQISAQQSVMKQVAQKQLNDQAQVEQKVKDDDDAIKAIDPDNFWNSRSTMQNIALGLALATGGYQAGLTGGKNQALEFVMKQIDNDIESQKLTNEQKLAKQKLALEKAQQVLKEQESKDDSELKRAQRAKIYSDINDKKMELYQQQLKMKMLRDGKGIDPMLLSKDELDRAVTYNGETRLALNMDAAKRIKDMQDTSEQGLANIDSVIAFANQGSKLSPADRSQMTTLIRTIQGQLKDEVIGPGTISESDRKILEEVAQNPFQIVGLKSSALVSLKTLRNKLENSIEKTYKNAGIKVQQISASDAAFRKGMAKGLSVERAEALRQKIKQSRGN